MMKKLNLRPKSWSTFSVINVVFGALLLVGPQQARSSSYLDDYFLPTAKLALNKIQQSLSPSLPDKQAIEASTTLAQLVENATTVLPSGANNEIADKQQTTTTATTTLEAFVQQHQRQETNYGLNEPQKATNELLPSKNDFVKLDTTPAVVTFESPVPSSSSSSPNTLTLSSTQATNEDPTSTVAQSDVLKLDSNLATAPNAAPDQTVVSSESSVVVRPDPSFATPKEESIAALLEPEASGGAVRSSPASETKLAGTNEVGGVDLTSNLSSQLEAAVGSDNNNSELNKQTQSSNAIVVESKSAEEAAIKETELEAVAAVDASIGFGGDLFASMGDPCHDEYGNARYCEPDFENVAFEKQVEVSSECGSPPTRFCTAYLNERNDQIRNCHICDAQHPKKRHPASFLTDMNNSNNPTCWVSAPINAMSGGQVNATGSTGGEKESLPQKSDNVTLILNLDKKYEILYISMQFCSIKPDSLAIFKSMDYGQSWLPYQFYSSQCRKMYGRQSRSSSPSAQLQLSSRASAPGVEQYLEPSCMNTTASASLGSGQQAPNSGRIAFSTLGDGRGANVDKSPILQDWITATNIKIVLDRHQASWIQSNLVQAHHHSSSALESNILPKLSTMGKTNSDNNKQLAEQKHQQQQQQPSNNNLELENSLTNPSNTFNYAMSDLTVGGRCKCNGHASRCIHSGDGKLQCDCRHNTAGRDCEKCATLHFDRPWARATQSDANPCQPCNCNGHSRKCRFDAELYELSGRRSGGVCIQCRDYTAGRFCHYCREGFTRDHSKPMSDKEACKHCDCHPIGSLGRVCNITTGQCPCKEGVAGLQCNRCAPGYQQSSSLTEPCIKLPENDINYEPSLTVDSETEPTSEQSSTTQTVVEKQQSNNNPSSSSDNAGEPSIAESPDIAPSVELTSKFNKQNNNRIDDDQSGFNSGMEPDKDAYGEAGEEQQGQLQTGRRKPHKAHHWQQTDGARNKYQNGYYRYIMQQQQQQQRNRHHHFATQAPLLDQEDELLLTANRASDNLMPDEEYPSTSGRGYYPYNGQQATYKQRFLPSDYRSVGQNRARVAQSVRARPNDILMKPLMSGLDDMMNGAGSGPLYEDDSDQQPGSGQQRQQNYVPIYNEDSFNQIQAPRNRHMVTQPNNARARQGATQVITGSARYRPPLSDVTLNNNQEPSASQMSCNDCQSRTRRFSMRQFCHHEFAIKATILNKFMAEDWTKFDVEIDDIFKSPDMASLSRNQANTNYVLDNMVQSDEALLPANQANINSSQVIQSDLMQPSSFNHKIKVGTVQSIWVPTEDLTCKCPKLKLRSTFLLMGTIDAKENSANSLQLDRHGVALEWKSSFQEKLIKYQMRQSRGKCST